jgi:HK97 gp10 family phage protein
VASVNVVISDEGVHALLQAEGVKVITVAALQVTNLAKQLCPVDTGRLRNSITWELGTIMGLPTARVGTNVEYAPYVELGTRYMAARSFLRAAVTSVVGSAL